MSLTAYMREFVRDYDLMAIRPRTGTTPLLKGRFAFLAHHPQIGEIEDAFDLAIDVPPNFPRELPSVIETGNRIPRTGFYHVNQHDHSLCLGSPLRLRVLLASKPSLVGFAETCVVPFLAGVSYKLKTGKPLPFGELNHGAPGALDDYQVLFEVETPEQALAALYLLGKKKRIANKLPCPCGCGVRLGRCKFRNRLIPFRTLANRPWYRSQFQEMSRELEIVAARQGTTVGGESRPYVRASSGFSARMQQVTCNHAKRGVKAGVSSRIVQSRRAIHESARSEHLKYLVEILVRSDPDPFGLFAFAPIDCAVSAAKAH